MLYYINKLNLVLKRMNIKLIETMNEIISSIRS